jgi:hypothetical protein
MTVRLMVLVFVLLALGGCQNPGRFQAALADTAGVATSAPAHSYAARALRRLSHSTWASPNAVHAWGIAS